MIYPILLYYLFTIAVRGKLVVDDVSPKQSEVIGDSSTHAMWSEENLNDGLMTETDVIQWNESNEFWPFDKNLYPPALTLSEQEKFWKLLRGWTEFAEKNNFRWIMNEGSLWGTICAHGPLPFDDDLDMFVMEDPEDIMKALKEDDEYEILKFARWWKFFPKDGIPTRYKHKAPFIDLLYLKCDEEFCSAEPEAKYKNIPKSFVLPVDYRPFGRHGPVPVPSCPECFLDKIEVGANYKGMCNWCWTPNWNHIEERMRTKCGALPGRTRTIQGQEVGCLMNEKFDKIGIPCRDALGPRFVSVEEERMLQAQHNEAQKSFLE